jgi:hypothetical protein
MFKALKVFIRPLYNPSAWAMIVIGSLLFMARIPLQPSGFINLPELATLIELVGGLFIITGFQVMVSMLFWPGTAVTGLLLLVKEGNEAAAIVVCGLKIFNGLSIVGFAIWLALSLNGAH